MSTFTQETLASILAKHPEVPGISVAVIQNYEISTLTAGYARYASRTPMTPDHFLQCASLSKTLAAVFAIEYFTELGISMDHSVNDLIRRYKGDFLIERTPKNTAYSPEELDGDEVTLDMLLNHTALDMHYVYGIPMDQYQPTSLELLDGSAMKYKYDHLYLTRPAGKSFSYSGGGFVVLQYLVELIEKKSLAQVMVKYLKKWNIDEEFTFLPPPVDYTIAEYEEAKASLPSATRNPSSSSTTNTTTLTPSSVPIVAPGHILPHLEVKPPLNFPPLAAGGTCTPRALAKFLLQIALAYQSENQKSPFNSPIVSSIPNGIESTTAHLMLDNLKDLGAHDFMSALIGLGVFVIEAGQNKFMLHQAANDGYRGVYLVCYEGPESGSGFVIQSNGDNPAVLLQAEVARALLKGILFIFFFVSNFFLILFISILSLALNISGINYAQYDNQPLSFDMKSVKQESIVNKGLKELVLSAFENPMNQANKKKKGLFSFFSRL